MTLRALGNLGKIPGASVGGVSDSPPVVIPREAFVQIVEDDEALRANYETLRNDYDALGADFEALRNDYFSLRRAHQDLSAAQKALQETCEQMSADAVLQRRAAEESVLAASRKGEEAILALLPVFDDLQRAVEHAKDPKLVQGLAMVLTHLDSALLGLGIERVAGVGEPFDPRVHMAVQQMETSEVPHGAVAVEVATGYRIGARLLRPSSVVVAATPKAKKPSKPASSK
jgi:molecular chaperone GrpE